MADHLICLVLASGQSISDVNLGQECGLWFWSRHTATAVRQPKQLPKYKICIDPLGVDNTPSVPSRLLCRLTLA